MKSRSAKCSAIAVAALLLSACSTVPQAPPEPDRSQAMQACPPLAPLTDDSFGAWVLWAQYVAGQYVQCRRAAVGR